MSNPFQNSVSLRRYMPAVLRQNGSGWYIEYYAFNQITKALERKRVKLNRERRKARTFAEFRAQANQMIIEINCKLASGWSPFCFYEGQPQYMITQVSQVPNAMPIAMQYVSTQQETIVPTPTPKKSSSLLFTTMIDKFLKIKGLELSISTMRSYNSFCHNIQKWAAEKYPKITCEEFTQRIAVEYLDHVFEGNNSKGKHQARKKISEDHVCARKYNNNLKMGRAVFSWAISHCYTEINPFEKIQTKREQVKQRTIIPADVRQQILEYYRVKNPAFEIICRMVFTSLIRPIEITRVRVNMINFEQHCFELPSDVTKNHRGRNSRIDKPLEDLLRKHIAGANTDDFLFADKAWKCGKVPMNSHSFTLVWAEMREALSLPETYQLYSLRDSGINGMLKANVNDLDVMQAAGHSDLKMTTRYANHVDSNLINRLNEQAPEF
ncbi:MAG: tyrosine-type recombinase/integrase [Paludibacteraceae bacterium]|nr:tyrosine-type recombinase/integrase [Paludibacteraceae bacterium]